MKAEEDVKEEAYNAFMEATSRCRRRCRAFQAVSDSSTIASSNFDFDSEESDSFDDSDFRDDEGKEEDEKEEDKGEEEGEDMAPDYPQEDFDSGRDSNTYKLRSPYAARLQPAIFFFFYFLFIGRPYYWP